MTVFLESKDKSRKTVASGYSKHYAAFDYKTPP